MLCCPGNQSKVSKYDDYMIVKCNLKKQSFKWIHCISGDDYRGSTLPKLCLTTASGNTKQSLESKGQFQYA